LSGTRPYEQIDRRTSVRRKEDYFWLKRLADLTGEVCLAVNRFMKIEFIDEKIFDLLQMPPLPDGELTELGQLTSLMAKQGYFGEGRPEVFEALIADLLTNQRLKQTKATQIINAVTPTGKHIDIRVSLGRDDGYLLLMRDVTQEELQRQALHTALEVGDSGYWFYNIHSHEFHVDIKSLNKHYSSDSIEEIQREGFTSRIHPEDQPLSRKVIKEVVQTAQSTQVLIRICTDNNEIRWMDCNLLPNVDEGGQTRSICCFFTDITKHIEIENALREAQLETETALRQKNAFLGGLSHEVRTPLNAVIGMTDALISDPASKQLKPQLVLIQNSAEKVMRMVDRILQHTKLADDAVEIDIQQHNASKIVKSTCDTWQSKAKANNINLQCIIKDNIPETVALDAYRFEQCLDNLLSNAIKFSENGTVQVLLAKTGSDMSGKLVLAVRDTGIGMNKESLAQIFHPFKQADKSISGRFGGTGLGLSIVKDLVELMGGTIKVSSEPGKGTVFVLSLPLAPEVPETVSKPAHLPTTPDVQPEDQVDDTEATKTANTADVATQQDVAPAIQSVDNRVSDPGSSNRYANLRVLIVDDNATNHIVASSLLSRVVGHIDTALNGEEAIEKLKQKEFDLVLMDIHMPVMDGIETTLAIRNDPSPYHDVPIVALTADPQYQQARLCRNIGMNSSLGKPIKLVNLLQAFDEVLFDDDDEEAASAA
jgi:signal transduction histidine kinase/ActR/RegA family two-component response regulator